MGRWMLPSPSDLRYFLEIAQTLNVSRAAERLGVSQPTLSVAVRRLEASLGTELLIRTKTGVRPTHSGNRLAAQARRLLNEWDRVRDAVLRDDNEIRGRYVLGCHPSVAMYSLPLVLPRLFADNPGLEVRLVHELSRKITEDVISFKVDFGIVVNPWEHPDLVIKPLCRDEVTVWSCRRPTPLQNLETGDAVLFANPEMQQVQHLLKQFKKKGLRYGRLVASDSLEVLTSLVAAGAGAGILPGRVASRVPSLGLRAVPGAPAYADRVCLVYRADAQRTPASRALARAIERAVREETPLSNGAGRAAEPRPLL
jgi:DNA-binding transcriptional LysR family regulator